MSQTAPSAPGFSDILPAEERLSVEIVASMLAADNIFSAAAELGHAASTHTVKIFKLQSKS